MSIQQEADNLYKESQDKLLSALLYSGSKRPEVFEIINSSDFSELRYELIFTAVLELSRRDEATDPVSVASELESGGNLEAVGGVQELYRMYSTGKQALMATPPKVYAKIIREHSAREKIRMLLSESTSQFTADSGTAAADALSDLQSNLTDHLYKLSNDSTVVELSELAAGYDELLAERKQRTEENEGVSKGLQGIPSLLPTLDSYTTGWKGGQMITVGARTGVGKSVYAVNAAVAAIQAGKSVMFFSLEMDENEIHDRIVSCTTSIPQQGLKMGTVKEEDLPQLQEQIKELKLSNLTLDVDAKQTIDSIRAKALRKAQSREGLDLIIIDYLQLITAPGRFASRREQVDDISRNVKLLAKQLNVPVMVLAQLNRASSNNEEEDGLPDVSHIRESGAIAQDSDIVILLHRERSHDGTLHPTKVILAKHRGGESDKIITCHSKLECSVFLEMRQRKEIDESEEIDLDIDSEVSTADDDFSFFDDEEGEDFDF